MIGEDTLYSLFSVYAVAIVACPHSGISSSGVNHLSLYWFSFICSVKAVSDSPSSLAMFWYRLSSWSVFIMQTAAGLPLNCFFVNMSNQ